MRHKSVKNLAHLSSKVPPCGIVHGLSITTIKPLIRFKPKQQLKEELTRGGTEHKDEVRARVIRIRQETYDRLKNFKYAGFGMEFEDVVTKSLDRLDELERRYSKKQRK